VKPQIPPHRRTVDMVEDGRVVVRHVFFGRDEAEAEHMERAHREADKSFDASLKGEEYEGVDIKAVRPFAKAPATVKEACAVFETEYARPSSKVSEGRKRMDALDRMEDSDW